MKMLIETETENNNILFDTSKLSINLIETKIYMLLIII